MSTANLLTADQTAKSTIPPMRLQATVEHKHHEIKEIEIEFPYFCKNDECFFMVESTEKVVVVDISISHWTSVRVGMLKTFEIPIINATPVSNEEFAEALTAAFTRITTPSQNKKEAA
jgi:hypothetical protein